MSDNTGECKCCDKLADEIECLRQQINAYRADIEQEVSAHTTTIETVHRLRRELAAKNEALTGMIAACSDTGILRRELAEAQGLLTLVRDKGFDYWRQHELARRIDAFLTTADQPTVPQHARDCAGFMGLCTCGLAVSKPADQPDDAPCPECGGSRWSVADVKQCMGCGYAKPISADKSSDGIDGSNSKCLMQQTVT